MNLLIETIQDIVRSGHSPLDIIFIGSRESGHRCTWEEFQKLADAEYDPGFGSQDVAQDLEIVFSDGSTMTRGEYDGSEWWQYSKPFDEPSESHQIKTLFCGMWGSLKEGNEQ